jgi:hypothetical protein
MARTEQIEPLDAMHAAEEQHDERAWRDAKPRAIAADGALRRVEVDAVGHDRDWYTEPEIANRVGLLFGRRMQQRRAFQIAALEQRVGDAFRQRPRRIACGCSMPRGEITYGTRCARARRDADHSGTFHTPWMWQMSARASAAVSGPRMRAPKNRFGNAAAT